MIIEISVAVIAVAFFLLALYLFIVMRDARQALQQATRLLEELRPEIKKNLESSQSIQKSIEEKMSALTPLFNAAEQAGELLEERATVLKKERHEREESSVTLAATAIVELARTALSLWKSLRERR